MSVSTLVRVALEIDIRLMTLIGHIWPVRHFIDIDDDGVWRTLARRIPGRPRADHDDEVGIAPEPVEVVPLMHRVVFREVCEDRTGPLHHREAGFIAQCHERMERFRVPSRSLG